MNCPSHEELRQSLFGELPEVESDRVFRHAESCPTCQTIFERIDSETPKVIEKLVRSSRSADSLPSACKRMMRDSSYLLQPKRDQQARSEPNSNETNFGEDTVRVIELIPGVDSIRDYMVNDCLGQGGMGTVYRATHRHLKRDVAIKVLKPRRHHHEQAAERFRMEMEAVGRLDHPNIIRAMDAGESDGTLYLVMEQIDGADVGQLIDSGPLQIADACDIIQQAATGLAYAHRKGMVHRDIKPSNLMITIQGVVKILDFGIATFETATEGDQTVFAGSVAYMAPEQCRDGDKVQSPADVFALGCTLFQLLTGNPPFQLSGDVLEQVQQRLDSQPPKLHNASIPAPLSVLTNQMLSPLPADRPTADEVARTLQRSRQTSRIRELVLTSMGKSAETSQTGWRDKTSPVARIRSTRYVRKWAMLATMVFVAAVFGWTLTHDGESKESDSPVPDRVASNFLSGLRTIELTNSSIDVLTDAYKFVFRTGY